MEYCGHLLRILGKKFGYKRKFEGQNIDKSHPYINDSLVKSAVLGNMLRHSVLNKASFDQTSMRFA